MAFARNICIILMVCVIVILKGAVADFEVNLLRSIGLNDYSPILLKDVKAVTRPNSNTRAYAFGSETGDQVINAGIYAKPLEKIITGFNARTYNQDITLLAIFRFNSQAMNKRNTLLSFISTSTGKNHLSIYLRPQDDSDNMVVEGQDMGSSSEGYNIYLDIDYYNGYEFFQYSVNLKDKAVIGNWTTLTVRVQHGTNLQVHLNCELVADQHLPGGFPNIPSDSELRIAQNTQKDFWTRIKGIVQRFQGDIHKVQFLFGEKAFKYLNPCGICGDSDTTISIEGQGTNPKCFDERARLHFWNPRSQKCKLNGSEYEDGKTWKTNQCQYCKCKDGRIKCKNVCKRCTSEGNVYKQGQTWTSHMNPCRRCSCNNGNVFCEIKLCRNTTSCRYGTVDIQGQCCPICKETHCEQQGRILSCGCRRKCSDLNPNAPCPGGCKLGCYCPPGTVENDKGKCVKEKECTCKFKGAVYRTNEIRAITQCKICVCWHGTMRCIRYC